MSMTEKQVTATVLVFVLVAVTVNVISLIIGILNKNKKSEPDKKHEKS